MAEGGRRGLPNGTDGGEGVDAVVVDDNEKLFLSAASASGAASLPSVTATGTAA